MTDPRKISINDYTYDLPDSRIAQFPLEKRDQSKLLVHRDGIIKESVFNHIHEFLPNNSLLIFNDTKVIQARILFKKQTGSSIELFCLEPYEFHGDISTALLQKGSCNWKCFVGNLKKWKTEILEKRIVSGGNEIMLMAEKLKHEGDTIIVNFRWEPEGLSFAEILAQTGLVPLPPYINRETVSNDKQRYQTIYASYDGSVAAPTAGLHFTEEVLKKLSEKAISKHYVTLHVGAGTFKPVSSQTMNGHEMHAERISVDIKLIEELIQSTENNIICVGTTSLRTIESLYWFGVKLITNKMEYPEINIRQWEPYNYNKLKISRKEALTAITNMLKRNNLKSLTGFTQLLIAPGYEFRIVNGIITNFHQPQSTLLLLIAAFIGESWKKVYQYALDNDFRFLSYGDSCILLRNK